MSMRCACANYVTSGDDDYVNVARATVAVHVVHGTVRVLQLCQCDVQDAPANSRTHAPTNIADRLYTCSIENSPHRREAIYTASPTNAKQMRNSFKPLHAVFFSCDFFSSSVIQSRSANVSTISLSFQSVAHPPSSMNSMMYELISATVSCLYDIPPLV